MKLNLPRLWHGPKVSPAPGPASDAAAESTGKAPHGGRGTPPAGMPTIRPSRGGDDPAAAADLRPRVSMPALHAKKDDGSPRGGSWQSSVNRFANQARKGVNAGLNRLGRMLQDRDTPDHGAFAAYTEAELDHLRYHNELPPPSEPPAPPPPAHAPLDGQPHYATRRRPMNAAEQAAETARAAYAGSLERPDLSPVAEAVEMPPRRPSAAASRPQVRRRPMTAAERAAEDARAEHFNEYPRYDDVLETVPQRQQRQAQAAAKRPPPSLEELRTRVQDLTRASGGATDANMKERTTAASRPQAGHRVKVGERVAEFLGVFSLHDIDRFESHHFIQAIEHLGADTRIQQAVQRHIDGNPQLGREMQQRWHDLRERHKSRGFNDQGLLRLMRDRPVALARYLLTGR